MSKITFRADEELVERIEARDASKSEIMREALREYLDADRGRRRDADATHGRDADAGRVGEPDAGPESRRTSSTRAGHDRDGGRRTADSIDALLAERVDELVSERLAAWEARTRDRDRGRGQDVNVTLTLESDGRVRTADADARRARSSDAASDTRTEDSPTQDAPPEGASNETTCGQCGESLSDDHVYCPNCGEKATHRVFCECGDEVRSDWGFCPSCGRRTPAADVLDQS